MAFWRLRIADADDQNCVCLPEATSRPICACIIGFVQNERVDFLLSVEPVHKPKIGRLLEHAVAKNVGDDRAVEAQNAIAGAEQMVKFAGEGGQRHRQRGRQKSDCVQIL